MLAHPTAKIIFMTTWLTVAEAAAYIKAKGTGKIREAIHRGELPAYSYGREIRLKAEEIDEWMESHPWEP